MEKNIKVINKYEDNLNDSINQMFLNNKELYLGEFEMKNFKIVKKLNFYFYFNKIQILEVKI